MEPTKKNKPNGLVIVLFGLIILMIVIYFILVMFFPEIYQYLTTGGTTSTPNTN